MNAPRIGDAHLRQEDFRFLTGQGRYIDDINLDGQAYAAVLRSTEAHAIIKAIDTSDAEAVAGVLLVLTGKDWAETGYGHIPSKSAVNKKRDGSPMEEPKRHAMAIDRVRFVGEPVALVVAETPEAAQQALELIDVDLDSLPAVFEQRQARAAGAPLVWDDIPGNLCLDFELGDTDGTVAAMAEADHLVTLGVFNNRVTSVPIEPRGVVAAYDAEAERFTLYNATQNVHGNRDTMAKSVLDIPVEQLHHIAPDVGGGFGAKNSTYPEPLLVLHAARQLGRPVKWINDRSGSFLADTHGRDQFATVELALKSDGTFLGLRTTTVGNIGAYCWTIGPFTPTGGSARTQGGPYRFPAILYSAEAAFTNTMPTDPYRGAGRPEGSYLLERTVEYAARELGMDPVELRRKNLIGPDELPRKSPMGLDVDCGDFPEVFERTLAMSDRDGFAGRVAESEARGCKRGFAIAPYLECTGGGPKEHAKVSFAADGRVQLAVGSQSTGMGHETSLAQILAARLGIDINRIDYVQGDTEATPIGGGHGGSRGMELGGNAVNQTSGEVVEKATALAAHLLETTDDGITFEDGLFRATATNRTMSMDDVIDASLDPDRLPDGMEAGSLNTASTFERGIISIPNGCHAAEVEVDPDTGTINLVGFWVVDDFGTIINPMLADGQVMGGAAQGIGQALMEQIVYDPSSGQLVSGSLMDYALPRADDMPRMDLAFYEGAPTAKNPLGVKGSGEAGCCGAPPAIVNAVLDALKDDGVLHIEMPLTPEKVWRAISEAGK